MAAGSAKLRFAMGVFEDLACLNSAADALMDLGLDPTDLCFMVARAVAPVDTADAWIAAEQSSPIAWFQHCGPALAPPPGGWFAAKAASLIAAAIEAAATPRPYRSQVSDVWSTMNTHLADGAFLLVAHFPSASLQDQAVRALLRYSRQPVHAEEFFQRRSWVEGLRASGCGCHKAFAMRTDGHTLPQRNRKALTHLGSKRLPCTAIR